MTSHSAHWPPYTHVPGVTPHPVSSPAGHSYGHPPLDAGDPQKWWTGEAFLRGVELFDAGYYWEAHEAWETTWKTLPRHDAQANFVKALIKLAAGGVKCLEGNVAGAARHFHRAAELLQIALDSSLTARFVRQAEDLIPVLNNLAASPPVCAAPSSGVPQPILQVTLAPLLCPAE